MVALPFSASANDPAEQRTILSVRPATIASALGDMGHEVAVEPLGEGLYRLQDRANRFIVYLGRCAAERCQLVQVRICRDGASMSEAWAARWNASEFYGRASIQANGLACVDDTFHAPDTLITFAALRAHVDGVLAISEPAFARMMEN